MSNQEKIQEILSIIEKGRENDLIKVMQMTEDAMADKNFNSTGDEIIDVLHREVNLYLMYLRNPRTKEEVLLSVDMMKLICRNYAEWQYINSKTIIDRI